MKKPNIILILADQLRADALGCYGNRLVRTPNLDRLAAEGAVFEQCMTASPTCTPSRASILTGRYPSAARTRMVGSVLPGDERTLPQLLRSEGYRTASIGKIHLVPQASEMYEMNKTAVFGEDGSVRYDYYGFEHIDLVNGYADGCSGNRYTPWLLERVPDAAGRLKRDPADPEGTYNAQRYRLPAEVHSSRYIGERAAQYIRSAEKDRPFFLHVSFPDPHSPYAVPEPYASMYDPDALPDPLPPVSAESGLHEMYGHVHQGRPDKRFGPSGSHRRDFPIGTNFVDFSRYTDRQWRRTKALYYGMVTLLDEGVGMIAKALEEEGMADETVVAFLSDHGDYMGDYGLSGKGFHFDNVLRVPLLYRAPGIRGNTRVAGIASTLDIAPTLLEFAGAPEPPGMQGVSVRGALTGTAGYTRRAALTENDDDFVPMKARTLTTADWKLNYYFGIDYGELFDRRSDPHETSNVWASPEARAVKAELTEMLLEEVLAAADTKRGRVQTPSAPIPKWIPKHHG